jgi:hypothetical protein
MLTVTLLVLGLVYVGRIPVDMLPRIVYPNVSVRVTNSGRRARGARGDDREAARVRPREHGESREDFE